MRKGVSKKKFLSLQVLGFTITEISKKKFWHLAVAREHPPFYVTLFYRVFRVSEDKYTPRCHENRRIDTVTFL